MVRIMIVDDSKLMVKVLTEYIHEYNPGVNIEVIPAYDGDEAIEKYNDMQPDLVFMDIKMPNRDGLSALKEIKKQHADAQIVMVTSVTQDESIKEAAMDGAIDYITKPFKGDVIRRVLLTHVGKKP